MAVAVQTTSTASTGNTADITITAPSGIVNGNLLVAAVFINNASAVTPPAGWTLIDNTPGSARMYMFYKVASGESGDYTFTCAATSKSGVMLRISGHDPASPIGNHTNNDSSLGTAMPTCNVNTTTPNSLAVYAVGQPNNETYSSYSSPLAENASVNTTNGNRSACAMASGIVAAAGATGSLGCTSSGSADGDATLVIVNAPASAIFSKSIHQTRQAVKRAYSY